MIEDADAKFKSTAEQCRHLIIDTHIEKVGAKKDGSEAGWRTLIETEKANENFLKGLKETESRLASELAEVEAAIQHEQGKGEGSRNAALEALDAQQDREIQEAQAVAKQLREQIQTTDADLQTVLASIAQTEANAQNTYNSHKQADDLSQTDHKQRAESWAQQEAELHEQQVGLRQQYEKEMAGIVATMESEQHDADETLKVHQRELRQAVQDLRLVEDHKDREEEEEKKRIKALEQKVAMLERQHRQREEDHKAATADIRVEVRLAEKRVYGMNNAVMSHVDMLKETLDARGIQSQGEFKTKISGLEASLKEKDEKLKEVERSLQDVTVQAGELINTAHENQTVRDQEQKMAQHQILSLEAELEAERCNNLAIRENMRIKKTLETDGTGPVLPRCTMSIQASGHSRFGYDSTGLFMLN